MKYFLVPNCGWVAVLYERTFRNEQLASLKKHLPSHLLRHLLACPGNARSRGVSRAAWKMSSTGWGPMLSMVDALAFCRAVPSSLASQSKSLQTTFCLVEAAEQRRAQFGMVFVLPPASYKFKSRYMLEDGFRGQTKPADAESKH